MHVLTSASMHTPQSLLSTFNVASCSAQLTQQVSDRHTQTCPRRHVSADQAYAAVWVPTEGELLCCALQASIAMARVEMQHGTNQPLKARASELIVTQTLQVMQMRQVLSSQYATVI